MQGGEKANSTITALAKQVYSNTLSILLIFHCRFIAASLPLHCGAIIIRPYVILYFATQLKRQSTSRFPRNHLLQRFLPDSIVGVTVFNGIVLLELGDVAR